MDEGSGEFRFRHPRPATGGGEFTGRPAVGRRRSGPICSAGWGCMGLQTLGLTLVLFFALPRFGQLSWRGAVVRPQPLVGFSDQVTLGELGQIIESREAVMRVRFYRYPGQTPQPVHGDIYLQGALLMDYEHGQWRAGQRRRQRGQRASCSRDAGPCRAPGWCGRRSRIEGMDRDELFFVAPYIALEVESPPSKSITAKQRLRRTDYRPPTAVRVHVGNDGHRRRRAKPLTPRSPERLAAGTLAMPPADGPDGLPNLVALASRWIAESGLPEQDRAGRAHYLEQQLARSGRFQYSLVGQDRDPHDRPDRGLRHQAPAGPLRILRHRA